MGQKSSLPQLAPSVSQALMPDKGDRSSPARLEVRPNRRRCYERPAASGEASGYSRYGCWPCDLRREFINAQTWDCAAQRRIP